MSKKDKESKVESAVTSTTEDQTPEASPQPEPSTEMAVVPVVQTNIVPADDGVTMQHLIGFLPHMKTALARTKRVEEEELLEAVGGLADDERQAFMGVLARMNPEKPGVYVQQRAFQVADIKLFQGTGNDPNRPEICPPGGYYTSQGEILAVPISHASLLKKPTALRLAVVMFFEGQQLWPLKDKNNNVLDRPGFPKSTNNAPLCSSLDRARGSFMGDCKACPFRPFKDGKPDRDGCRSEATFYVVVEGFTGIYRMIISGTSIKPCAQMIKTRVRTWATPWDYFFEITASPQAEGDRKWWVSNAKATETATPEAARKLLSLISRQVETEVYLPTLANLYQRPPGRELNQAAPAETPANVAALAASVKAAPDYSKNNI